MTNQELIPPPLALPPAEARAADAEERAVASGAFSLYALARGIALREQNLMRLLFKSWAFIIFLCLLLAISVGYNVLQAQRVGTVVLIDRTTGVAVSVNNRTFGSTPSGALLPDKPGFKEMQVAAKSFLDSVYRIDPVARVRLREAAAGVRMMTPLSAIKYGTYVEENGIWNTQIAQSQQASWTVNDENVTLVSREPLVLSVYGEQRLKKVEGGATKVEVKQVAVPVTLMADPEGRTERNFFTGFNVDAFGPEKVLSFTTEVQDSFETKALPPPSPSPQARQ